MINVDAYAKVNLILSIVGVENGRHIIDSVVAPFPIADKVSIDKNNDDVVRVFYSNWAIDKDIDTAYKMGDLIKKHFHLGGVDIKIEKHIPLGAGLGGSSADAGAVARGMAKLFGIKEIPTSLLLEVGSDVPYMYKGGQCRIGGVGEKVEKVNLPNLYMVLIADEKSISTKECYDLYDKIGGDNRSVDTFLADIAKNCAVFSNALQKAGIMLNENVEINLRLLQSCGFSACMTGSGSGVVGYVYSKEDFRVCYDRLMTKRNGLNLYLSLKEY